MEIGARGRELDGGKRVSDDGYGRTVGGSCGCDVSGWRWMANDMTVLYGCLC